MITQKLTVPAVAVLISALFLTGCTSDIVDPVERTSPPVNVAPEDQPDVLVPISAALESAIRNDVEMTKNNVEVYLLTNPDATEAPAAEIFNRNPKLATIEVTFEDNAFTVTGKQVKGNFEYVATGNR